MGKKKRDKRETGRDQAADKRGRARGGRPFGQIVREYAKAIGTALVIALLLRQFVFQAFRIPTGSMLETLQIGDFLFVNKFLYVAKTPERISLGSMTLVSGLPVLKFPAIREPRQGDIIVFEFPQDRNLDYIKRCVAVAGDSAGGNLAIAVCLLARERGGPGIDHQLLIYPVTDRDFDTEYTQTLFTAYANGFLFELPGGIAMGGGK